MDLAFGINGLAQVTTDNVFDLRKALKEARTPECDVSDGTLVRQMLDQAAGFLENCHVFIGTLPTGVRLFFVSERLPMYVSPEAALKAAGFTGEL